MNASAGPPTSDRFRQYLENLGRDIEPGSGFFSPDTVFWRVSREPALLLAGMRALLLQIAHPKIAQGVADHSRYREDPLGRGIRTFTAVYSLVFGDRDEAIETAMRVRFVHDHVHGQVMGLLPAGMDSSYDANDPELLCSDTLTVTDTARDIYRGLLTGSWFTRLLAPFNYSMAALLLPEQLVESFGMRRNVLARMTFCIIVWITRGLVKLLPLRLRGMPAARRRE